MASHSKTEINFSARCNFEVHDKVTIASERVLEVGPKFVSRNHKTFRSHIVKVSAKVMHLSGAKQHRYNTINSQHSFSWINKMVEKNISVKSTRQETRRIPAKP